ncbi:MAG: hypothetical protein Q9168_003415 [Polycauliona sp. 1 TL-2023]
MLLPQINSDQGRKQRLPTLAYLLLTLAGSFLLAGWVRKLTSTDGRTTLVPPAEIPKDTLILYAYHESDNARRNADFFIRHGLHDAADFIIIINGEETRADTLQVPDAENIRVIRRENTCYDMGSYGVVLRDLGESIKQYKRFILLNSSIRGPFVPHWSQECWSDAYLGRVTDQVKLVGMSYNCYPARHVQSMIFATDDVGLEVLLDPAAQSLGSCPDGWKSAVQVEMGMTAVIKKAGYQVDAMMQEFHQQDDFSDSCKGGDRLGEGSYPKGQAHGPESFLHPYETLFFKANRGVQERLMNQLTNWTDAAGYSSYDACRRPSGQREGLICE